MCWPPRITSYESGTWVSTCVTYGSHDTMASTLPSASAGARPNCDQMFSMVSVFVFHLGAAQHHLEIFVGGLPAREADLLALEIAELAGLDAPALLGDDGERVSQLSLVASFMIRPITLNGSPACTALR